MRRLIVISILAVFMLVGMAAGASADWASKFVVYDGGIYRVADSEISADKIGKKVGKVTRYSDREGTYRGNFSNTFAKGTPYYAIQGVDTHEQIAVKGPDGAVLSSGLFGRLCFCRRVGNTGVLDRISICCSRCYVCGGMVGES